MTTLLAIDTATGPCSAAVWKEGRIAAYVENAKPIMQSASLMPLVEQALKQSGTAYQQLSAVAATIGPGSFTGIRVGLAAARGIAFAANIPARGYTTLEVLAFAACKQAGDQPILAILNAGKGEWYHQRFTPDALPAGDVQLTGLERVDMRGPLLAAGNAPLDGSPHSGITFPRADALAMLAAQKPGSAQAMVPFYIRDPDAKLPQKKA